MDKPGIPVKLTVISDFDKEVLQFVSYQRRYTDEYNEKYSALMDQGIPGVQIKVVECGICSQ